MLIIEFVPLLTFRCAVCDWQSIVKMPPTCPMCGHIFKSIKVIFIDGSAIVVAAEDWHRARPTPPSTLG